MLDALHGYSRYYQRQDEELKRLRGLYSKVNKKQRKVSCPLSVSEHPMANVGMVCPIQQLEQLVHYSDQFAQIEKLVKRNQIICDRIVENALEFYEIDRSELDKHVQNLDANGRKADKVAVSQSLKHIVRDWTEAGGPYERNKCFACIIKTLDTLFSENEKGSGPVKVLLPGAGLGRLGRDVSQRGQFQTQIILTILSCAKVCIQGFRSLSTSGPCI